MAAQDEVDRPIGSEDTQHFPTRYINEGYYISKTEFDTQKRAHANKHCKAIDSKDRRRV